MKLYVTEHLQGKNWVPTTFWKPAGFHMLLNILQENHPDDLNSYRIRRVRTRKEADAITAGSDNLLEISPEQAQQIEWVTT